MNSQRAFTVMRHQAMMWTCHAHRAIGVSCYRSSIPYAGETFAHRFRFSRTNSRKAVTANLLADCRQAARFGERASISTSGSEQDHHFSCPVEAT
ncbi:hypothetical protein KCP73_25765 [Salmonella enterica subsp. enterica]|nr:hypothetical protein KCP73_25765 [Salmonella enterica subsp. enterica]